jgi:hypothetical protein
MVDVMEYYCGKKGKANFIVLEEKILPHYTMLIDGVKRRGAVPVLLSLK